MFNSGVRAILQDRSGNYWFGSHFEGVCRFDGEHFQCFTEADGLSNNQVRSIQEDARGTIWFDNGVGISSYAAGTIASSKDRRYDATDETAKFELALELRSGTCLRRSTLRGFQ
jgi:ligand-binding sensor domain-containing protein